MPTEIFESKYRCLFEKIGYHPKQELWCKVDCKLMYFWQLRWGNFYLDSATSFKELELLNQYPLGVVYDDTIPELQIGLARQVYKLIAPID